MATTIDSRVVEMRFDNDQFEKGVNQSINSLDKLKTSLDFNDLSKSVKTDVNPSISSIGEAIETVANKFNSFANIVRTTAIVKYASKILDIFSSLRKMFTTDMMAAGWNKYEQLMSSTQTIMFATRDEWDDQAAQMEYIEGQLEKLMWYTDETSYDFADMANNIGKFTSAGVGLEDSVSAMMGISSWAALSGKNAQAASVAMYNLSQALAIGAVTTADWKSIELQNMATKEFKQTVIDTAVAMGKLKKGEVDVESFRTSLKTKWFDNEVLLAVLKKFGDFSMKLNEAVDETGLTASEFRGYIQDFKDGVITMDDLGTIIARDEIEDAEGFTKWMEILTDEYYDLGFEAFKAGQECKTFTDVLNATKDALSTGWVKTFKALTGDYLQSKELWSSIAEDIYDLLVEPLNVRNKILKSFNQNSGRDAVVQGLYNIWSLVLEIILKVRDAFNKAFPKTTATQLMVMAYEFLRITKNIKEQFENLRYLRYFEYIEKAATNAGTVMKNLRITVTRIGRAFSEAWLEIFPKGDPLGSFLKKIADISDAIVKLSELIYVDMGESIDDADSRYSKLIRTFKGVAAIFDILRQLFVAIIKPFRKTRLEATDIGDSILDTTAAWGDWLVQLDETIRETQVFDKAVTKVIDFFKSVPGYLDNLSMKLFGLHLDEVWGKIVDGAKLAVGALISLVVDIGENPEDWDIIAIWDKIKEKVGEAWETIKEFVASIPDKMAEVRAALFGEPGEDDENKKKFSFSDLIEGVKTAYRELGKFFGWIEQYDEKGVKINSPFERFMMDLQEKWEWFIGKLDELKEKWEPVGEWIMENIFSKEGLDEGKKVLKTAGIVGSIAALLFLLYKVLFNAFNIISTLKGLKGDESTKEPLLKRVLSVFGPVGYAQDMAAAAKTNMQNIGKLIKGGYFAMMGLLVLELAAALMIVSKALADNPVETMSGFFILLGGTLMMWAMAMSLMQRSHFTGDNMKQLGLGFALMGVVFLEIAGALWIISNYVKPELLLPSVIALGVLLGALVGAFIGLEWSKVDPEKMISLAGAMVIMSVSFVVIAAALKLLEGLSWEELANGMIALMSFIAVFVVLGALVSLYEPIGAALVQLGVSFLAFGAGIALVGAGIWLAADGIAKLVEIGPDGMVSMGEAILVFLDMLPDMIPKIGEAFRLFIEEIIKSRPQIRALLLTICDVILSVLDVIAPRVLKALGTFLSSVLDLLNMLLPKLETLVLNLFDFIIVTTEYSLLGLGQMVWDTTIGLLEQALENIGQVTALLTAIGIEMVLGFLNGIAEEADDIVDTAFNVVISWMNAISDGIDEHAEELRASGVKLINSIVRGVKTVLGLPATNSPTVSENAKSTIFEKIGKSLSNSAITGIKEKAEAMWEALVGFGKKIIEKFVEGMKIAADVVKEGSAALGELVINTVTGKLDEHSPSKVFEEIGENVDLGFANGIDGYADRVKDSAADLATTATDGFNEAIQGIKGVLDDELNSFKATITPVIDLGMFTAGITTMTNDLLGLDNIVPGVSSLDKLTGGFNANLSGQKVMEYSLANMAERYNNEEGLGNSTVTNNTFNVTGDDPKSIAEEISNILQRQVERRSAVWG